jgi:hypothetical protein
MAERTGTAEYFEPALKSSSSFVLTTREVGFPISPVVIAPSINPWSIQYDNRAVTAPPSWPASRIAASVARADTRRSYCPSSAGGFALNPNILGPIFEENVIIR